MPPVKPSELMNDTDEHDAFSSISNHQSCDRFNSMQGLRCKSNAADWHWQQKLALTQPNPYSLKKLVLMWPWLVACNALPSASLQWCRKTCWIAKIAAIGRYLTNWTLAGYSMLFTAHIDSAWRIHIFYTQTDHVSSPTANKPGLNLHSWHSRHHRPRLSCCIDGEAPSIDRFNMIQCWLIDLSQIILIQIQGADLNLDLTLTLSLTGLSTRSM